MKRVALTMALLVCLMIPAVATRAQGETDCVQIAVMCGSIGEAFELGCIAGGGGEWECFVGGIRAYVYCMSGNGCDPSMMIRQRPDPQIINGIEFRGLKQLRKEEQVRKQKYQ